MNSAGVSHSSEPQLAFSERRWCTERRIAATRAVQVVGPQPPLGQLPLPAQQREPQLHHLGDDEERRLGRVVGDRPHERLQLADADVLLVRRRLGELDDRLGRARVRGVAGPCCRAAQPPGGHRLRIAPRSAPRQGLWQGFTVSGTGSDLGCAAAAPRSSARTPASAAASAGTAKAALGAPGVDRHAGQRRAGSDAEREAGRRPGQRLGERPPRYPGLDQRECPT